jgi:hypothetical protein
MTFTSLLAVILIVTPKNSVDPNELTSAIFYYSKSDANLAALMLTVGLAESNFSARIAAGECKPWECDRGKAWGIGQEHKNKINAEYWGAPEPSIQIMSMSRALKSAYYTCKHRKAKDWLRCTINGYAGKHGDWQWAGLEQRVRMFESIRSKL